MRPSMRHRLREAVLDAGYDPLCYSGRGMYGRTCLGVRVPQGTSPFRLAAELARTALADVDVADECTFDAADTFIDNLAELKVCEDSLGLDTVVYFPDVPCTEEDLEERERDTLPRATP